MRRSARPPASELIAGTAELARQRQRLERLLVASGPILAAVATVALGLLPAWVGALVALASIAWAASGLGADRETELEAARRIDRRLDAKETFLTWTTVPEAGRGTLWPVVADRATEVARGANPRRFATSFEWRRPLLSLAVSVAAVALAALVVQLKPVAPTTELAEIAERLAAPGRDAASRALGAELRELARKLSDPTVAAEEKRQLAAEMRAKLEEQQKAQQGQQGSSAGKGEQQQKTKGEQSGAGEKGDQRGEEKGAGDREAAASALGKIEKDIAGESSGEKDSEGAEKAEQSKGGGIQGPSEGQRAGEKPGDQAGNQPGPKDDGGKSERGEGEGGRESGERPQGQQGQNEQQPSGQSQGGSGEGSGAAGKPSLEDDGQKAERYYRLGEGPDALRVEDGQYVRVLVPEQGGGVGTERVKKPGEAIPETPFGNAPLPSEGPPGEANERQPLPLEYRPILRR